MTLSGTKYRWILILLAGGLVLAWVAKPRSLRKKLEVSGVILVAKPKQDFGGMYTVTYHNVNGRTVIIKQQVFTRGLYFRPIFDYERVWNMEYEGKTTVCIDPDSK